MNEQPRRGRTIATRVFILVGLGMLAPLGMMAWAGWVSFQEIDRHEQEEKERVAVLTARRLDAALAAQLQALRDVPGDLRTREGAVAAVKELRAHHRDLFDEHFVLDPQGALLVRDPSPGSPLDGVALAARARRTGRSFQGGMFLTAEATGQVVALLPVLDDRNQLVAVVGGAADPGGARLQGMIQAPALGPEETVDLLDTEGKVIASTNRLRVGEHTLQSDQLSGLLRRGRPASGLCSDCGPVAGRSETYAFAPLATARWGVLVRQPVDAAWEFAGSLTRNVVLAAVALFTLALLFAWGAALSVTRPLAMLTGVAERISGGELETPVPPLPADEVGRLGAALETMRQSLSASVRRIEQANLALELRVSERTHELTVLNQVLEERERARTRLLRQVITAQEAERKRIARELHDETCQSLSALVMGMQRAAEDLPGPARAKVQEATGLAEHALAEVHRLIVDLRPSVLDDLGLQSAIAWYADRMLKARHINVRCEFSGLEARLPHDLETVLFRVAQEAMTNIARHAHADTVLVQCTRRDGLVTLEVEDDGEGFDPRSLGTPDERGRGLGLLGMRERVELFGGTMTVDSAPGQGTHLVLTVPVSPVEEVAHG